MPNAFGTRLKAAMRAANMRPRDIADLCAVRPETVRKWFKMAEARLEARHAACIAHACRTDLMELIEGRPKRKTSRRGLISLSK